MTMRALVEAVRPTATPQHEPIPGRGAQMTQNDAGGFVFAVDDWTRLERFILLGTERGTYYSKAPPLTRQNAQAVERCIKDDGARVVDTILAISATGKAPHNDPALFALAMAAKLGDAPTRKLAYEALPEVARIGTHLFHFAAAAEAFGGWGRGMRRAVGRWYANKDIYQAVYQVTKYQQRDGWSHRDLLRLAHPTPDGVQALLYSYIVNGTFAYGKTEAGFYADLTTQKAWEYIKAIRELREETDINRAAALIAQYSLPREVVPTELLTQPIIWYALLQHMPLGALIRNLPTLTRVGLLKKLSGETKTVTDRLADSEALAKARIHPMTVLMALKTYESGHGLGSRWIPVQQIVDALNECFYASMECAVPTGKKFLVALNCSGSMGYPTAVGGIDGLRANEAGAALALAIARTEPQAHIMGFTTSAIDPIGFTKHSRLPDALAVTSRISGGTSCGIPAAYACEQGIEADVLVIITGNETWHTTPTLGHPAQALQRYRRRIGRPVKLVAIGMTATGGTVADIDDPLSLSLVGFDSGAVTALNSFVGD